jgi:putative addiction module component (TIGR02574 family)
MSPILKALRIDRMSVAERLALVQEIWDSIAATPEEIPVTKAQLQELDRRMAEPDDGTPWKVAKAEALARLQQ